MNSINHKVLIQLNDAELEGDLHIPPHAIGLIVFSHGSGSSRNSPRNKAVAEYLNQNGFATLLFDLLTPDEDKIYENRFDINLLSMRLVGATKWLTEQENTKFLPIGYFGASTGAASALFASAALGTKIKAVVSRGGRPDLAVAALPRVSSPVLLLVGGLDEEVLDLNKKAFDQLNCLKELVVIKGATHLFEEPGAMEEVALQALHWFKNCIKD